MSEIFIPIALTIAGIFTAFMAYRGLRRGGARFYTLEREAILRRAGLSLISSTLMFTLASGLFIYEHQAELAVESTAAVTEGETIVETPTVGGLQFPPTDTPTATPDLTQPTATATSVICRAQVINTSFGLYLRDSPGGEDIGLLAEGDLVTMLEDAPVQTNEFVWRKVRALGGEEGWVAQEFLEIGSACQ